MMIKTINSFLKKHSLTLLGLLMIMIFIWFRYIRKRLPKDIPFNLSFWGLIIIITLCFTYFYIIKSLIKPSNTNESILHKYLIPLFYIPLEALDAYIKKNMDVGKVVNLMYNRLIYSIKNTTSFYFMFAIFPRLILVTLLFTDVFIDNKLHYLYYFIHITLLLFLNKYIIYSLKIYKKHLVNILAPDTRHVTTTYIVGVHPQDTRNDPNSEDLDDVPECMSLPLDIFVDFEIQNRSYNYQQYPYTFTSSDSYHANFLKRYNILDKNYTRHYRKLKLQEVETILKPKMEAIIDLGCLIESYNKTSTQNKRFKLRKILVFTNYFLCWLYILIRSIPYIQIYDVLIRLFELFRTLEEPFSGEMVGLFFGTVYFFITQ